MDGQTAARFFPLPFGVNKDPELARVRVSSYFPKKHTRVRTFVIRARLLSGFVRPYGDL